jgi:hypothetical protein
MKPEERDAVIEECAEMCFRMAARHSDIRSAALQAAGENIRALTAQSPAGVPPEPQHVEDAIRRACDEPTLVDALSFVALWECERVIPQAHEFLSGRKPRDADGRGWDTCFGHLFARVIAAWNERAAGVPTTEPVAQPDENEQLERMRERLRKANQSPMHADALSSREPATDGTPSGGPMRPVGIRDGGTAEPVAQEPCHETIYAAPKAKHRAT